MSEQPPPGPENGSTDRSRLSIPQVVVAPDGGITDAEHLAIAEQDR
jgi:hypothetical protein